MYFNIIILINFALVASLEINKYILNELQTKYKLTLENPKIPIVLCTGPAGSGKTMIACHEAVKSLKAKKINKIIITRPTVTVEENLGFLPGSLEDKLYPFMIPIYEYFQDFYTQDQITSLIHNGRLEIAPLAFMRGRTFSDCFVIADEMQNSSPNQFKMILTRLGENSKLVITGDLQQNDIGNNNGLNDFIKLLNKKYTLSDERVKDGFEHIVLDSTCIKRHEIIHKILEMYEEFL